MPSPEVPLTRNCGTMGVHEHLVATDPEYRSRRLIVEGFAQGFARAAEKGGPEGILLIPVVVHVVHSTAAQNVSDAQIHSQIAVLNHDYRKANPDAASTPAPFAPFVADAEIAFCMATVDPSGNATNGITRTHTTKSVFHAEMDDIKAAVTGGHDAWSAEHYLNMWIAPGITDRKGRDLLGYGQFPGGPPATDGVVILCTAFGNTGTASAPFDRGRTATHEVGHWLNLLHIWGDDLGGCTGSDQVVDTPNQANANGGKPAFPSVSCGNDPDGDMFMNYMDYTDDDTMYMFTPGQVARMRSTLAGPRSSVVRSSMAAGMIAARAEVGAATAFAIPFGEKELGHVTERVFDGRQWLPAGTIDPQLLGIFSPR